MDKYINTIQICIKANKITFGETMLFDIRDNKVSLVIIAKDAGVSNAKKIKDKCSFYKVKFIDNLFTKEEIKNILNKDVAAFGIKDKGLSAKFLSNLQEKEEYYGKQ